MKDDLLQQIVGLIEQPTLLLNLPEPERLDWETALFDLAELLEDFRSGVLAKDLPLGFSRYSSQDYLKTPEDVRAYAEARQSESVPVAWISYNMRTGREYIEKVPVVSLQPGDYKHTPLYTAVTADDAARMAAAPRPTPTSEWQPIETAPRNGKEILCLCANGDCHVVYGHYYNGGLSHEWAQFAGDKSFNPTHWMPLPEPPTGLQQPEAPK